MHKLLKAIFCSFLIATATLPPTPLIPRLPQRLEVGYAQEVSTMKQRQEGDSAEKNKLFQQQAAKLTRLDGEVRGTVVEARSYTGR